jgi:putative aminopeptidase FrvX
MKRTFSAVVLGAILIAIPGASSADSNDVKDVLKEIWAIPSASGNEEILAAKIIALLPKGLTIEKDNLGSLFGRLGQGEGGLTVVAGLDQFGYAVSAIMSDGYLQLDRLGPPPLGIYDSFLIGHPVVVSTKAGLRNGIVVQPAMHVLTPELRDKLSKSLTLDLVYVDVGAHSEAEVRAKGIEILDPVTFNQDMAVLANGRLAGPALGQKAVCAALTALADRLSGTKVPQTISLAWMAQSRMSARGARASLGAIRAKNRFEPKTTVVLGVVSADRGEKSPVFGKGPVLLQAKDSPSPLREAIDAAATEKNIAIQNQSGIESPLLAPFLGEGADAVILALPVKFFGTPSEVVETKDIQSLLDIVSAVCSRRGK